MAQNTLPGQDNSARVGIIPDINSPAGALRVLVVDESDDMRVYLRRCLLQFGTLVDQILEASSGQEALAIARINPIDLLICGSSIPQMGGHALCDAIRADERTSSILIMSLVDEDSGLSTGQPISSAADTVLASPFNATRFAKCFAQLMLDS